MTSIAQDPTPVYTVKVCKRRTHSVLIAPTGAEIATFYNPNDAPYVADCINDTNANADILGQAASLLERIISESRPPKRFELQSLLVLINTAPARRAIKAGTPNMQEAN